MFQQNKISLKLALHDSKEPSKLIINTDGYADQELDVPMFDNKGNQFMIKCKLNSVDAGVCIVFYTPHCLLSRTDKPLTFCYDKEGEHIFPQITEHTGRNRECVTMFNDC